jgi:hypothetical protein
VVILTADITNGKLVFDNHLTSGGSYDLQIGRVNTHIRQDFYHSQISIAATDTHYINFADRDGKGTITIEIDHNSDGTIDETIVVENQLTWLFLPILIE